MDRDKLREEWLHEEKEAHIHGWDFSHINSRYEEENDLPWDYRAVIMRYLRSDMKLLDIDTGGGEFLLSLAEEAGIPERNLSAAEKYPPNVELCRQSLLPLGVDFRESGDLLPFDDSSFDIVINRHGDFDSEEIYRVLKPGGFFVTEQVGAENDRELVELLLSHGGKEKLPLPFPKQYLSTIRGEFEKAGFSVLEAEEAFRPIKFYDVGALVWFARIIEWEFPNFSVDSCLEKLYRAQEILEECGCIEGTIHRFMLAVRK